MMLRDRFGGETSGLMQRYSSSLDVDLQMLEEDIRGSMAHVRMLGEVGLLSSDEVSALSGGLALVWQEIRDGDWVPGDDLEDVHMAVESRLIEHLGDLGGKLHTARSRNDQVATDVRLWLKARLAELDAALVELIGALLDRVEADGRTLIPGFTHVQRGQPILLGHHLLAHAWPLQRDRGRFADALARLDTCPLGACAMAGTSLPIDRQRTAELLEFAAPVDNAMDAVSARDHHQEVAAACAIAMNQLSRMAEELVWWSSSEFALVRLGDEHATGSSIMPQKRNPDAAELVRGKTATVHGHLATLLALVKAQPLSYNRDLQQGRAPLFAAVITTIDSVRLTAEMWRDLTIDTARYENALDGDFSLATEIADFLVRKGLDFRRAHRVAARIVKHCEEQGINLAGLTAETAAAFHPALDTDLSELLDPRGAAERRDSLGGSAWPQIERQVASLRERL
jgi:argininosuccinate lyase